MMHNRHNHGSNGNGASDTANPEIVEPEIQPTGQAFPIHRQTPQGYVMMSHKVVWFGVGVAAGATLAWLLFTSIADKKGR